MLERERHQVWNENEGVVSCDVSFAHAPSTTPIWNEIDTTTRYIGHHHPVKKPCPASGEVVYPRAGASAPEGYVGGGGDDGAGGRGVTR